LGLALLAAALFVNSPQERPAMGLWRLPLDHLGSLLYENFSTFLNLSFAHFCLMDVLVMLAALMLLQRRWSRFPHGSSGAGCLRHALLWSMAGLGLIEVWGLLRGGDFRQSLWQARQLLYVPIMALVFLSTWRTAHDRRVVGAIVLAAAIYKALMGIYFGWVLSPARGWSPAYVTTHSDTILFASAVIVVLVAFYELPSARHGLLAAASLPLLAVVIVLNNRRLAHAAILASIATTWVVVPWSRLKRGVTRAALLAAPLLVLYVAVGWSSSAAVFAPLSALRSISGSEDRSVVLRDIEDYNLVYSMRTHPLLGSGLGHEYSELILATDVAQVFPQYKFIPHNSLLGLWAFGGLIGFTAIWLPIGIAVFLAVRSHPRARSASDRAAALAVIGVVIAYAAQAWGDMGLQSWECTFLVAAALAVAGGLAVEVGAWPAAGAGRGDDGKVKLEEETSHG
ncbi:MAG: hypothetical protein HY901_31460, partial [Deltaproteobacteria bacterium]|nr:hypothetical protein [Deltaproteobacteria bacterium]